MGVVGANGTEAGGSSCGVPEIGEKVGGKKYEVRFMAEGGGVQSTSGRGDTHSPDLLGQEIGNSRGMGGLTSDIW